MDGYCLTYPKSLRLINAKADYDENPQQNKKKQNAFVEWVILITHASEVQDNSVDPTTNVLKK